MEIITRAQCGLRAPSKQPSPMKTCAGLIVHCTAGNQPVSVEDSIARWRGVQRYHMTSPKRMYADIGYSFGFDDFGQVLEGRGWDIHGAHSGRGWNSHYHGLCYLGSGEEPTWRALCALKKFIDEHDRRYGPHKEVIGHRDIANKGCPGQGVYDYLVEHFACRNPHVEVPIPECSACGQPTTIECPEK